MKGIKKLAALAVGIVMSATVFTGCSTDGMTLYNAFEKSQDVKSAEVETNISLSVSAKNMSPQEEQTMAMVLPAINSTKINAVTRTTQNKDKTAAKAHSDIKMNIGQMPMDMSVWVDTDLTSDKPYIKEVFKMPALFTAQAPAQFAGKEYAVLDMSQMPNVPGAPQMDYKKLAQFSKEFQPKFMEFFKKYAEQFNPDSVKVTKLGEGTWINPYYYGPSTAYELRITDKTFKELMRYAVKNFAENKEVIPFIKDYMLAVMSITGLPENEAIRAKLELEKAFFDFEVKLPGTVRTINEALDKIQDVNILGENGIVIKYFVNDKGYIIYEDGTAEFVVDLPALAKLNGDATVGEGQPTGVYTINVKFSNETRLINLVSEIKLPETNKDNSFNYFDLINLVPASVQ